jgi:hypothetical protein
MTDYLRAVRRGLSILSCVSLLGCATSQKIDTEGREGIFLRDFDPTCKSSAIALQNFGWQITKDDCWWSGIIETNFESISDLDAILGGQQSQYMATLWVKSVISGRTSVVAEIRARRIHTVSGGFGSRQDVEYEEVLLPEGRGREAYKEILNRIGKVLSAKP